MASYQTLEEQKDQLLRELHQWAPARLVFQSEPASWSALQMLDHIVRTEREILAAVYAREHKPHRIGLSDRLRTRFLTSVFRSERRVKVPPSAAMVLPGVDLSMPSLTAEWSQIRAILGDRLQQLFSASSSRALFYHPVGGWMSMQAVLDFFSVHLLHHGFQLRRIRAASKHLQPDSDCDR